MKIQNNQQGVITDASQNNQQGVITGQNQINKFLSVQEPVGKTVVRFKENFAIPISPSNPYYSLFFHSSFDGFSENITNEINSQRELEGLKNSDISKNIKSRNKLNSNIATIETAFNEAEETAEQTLADAKAAAEQTLADAKAETNQNFEDAKRIANQNFETSKQRFIQEHERDVDINELPKINKNLCGESVATYFKSQRLNTASKIQLFAGKYIDKIMINDQIFKGGKGSAGPILTLGKDEYINRIEYSKNEQHKCLGFIRMYTNKSQKIEGGTRFKNYRFVILPNIRVISIAGWYTGSCIRDLIIEYIPEYTAKLGKFNTELNKNIDESEISRKKEYKKASEQLSKDNLAADEQFTANNLAADEQFTADNLAAEKQSVSAISAAKKQFGKDKELETTQARIFTNQTTAVILDERINGWYRQYQQITDKEQQFIGLVEAYKYELDSLNKERFSEGVVLEEEAHSSQYNQAYLNEISKQQEKPQEKTTDEPAGEQKTVPITKSSFELETEYSQYRNLLYQVRDEKSDLLREIHLAGYDLKKIAFNESTHKKIRNLGYDFVITKGEPEYAETPVVDYSKIGITKDNPTIYNILVSKTTSKINIYELDKLKGFFENEKQWESVTERLKEALSIMPQELKDKFIEQKNRLKKDINEKIPHSLWAEKETEKSLEEVQQQTLISDKSWGIERKAKKEQLEKDSKEGFPNAKKALENLFSQIQSIKYHNQYAFKYSSAETKDKILQNLQWESIQTYYTLFKKICNSDGFLVIGNDKKTSLKFEFYLGQGMNKTVQNVVKTWRGSLLGSSYHTESTTYDLAEPFLYIRILNEVPDTVKQKWSSREDYIFVIKNGDGFTVKSGNRNGEEKNNIESSQRDSAIRVFYDFFESCQTFCDLMSKWSAEEKDRLTKEEIVYAKQKEVNEETLEHIQKYALTKARFQFLLKWKSPGRFGGYRKIANAILPDTDPWVEFVNQLKPQDGIKAPGKYNPMSRKVKIDHFSFLRNGYYTQDGLSMHAYLKFIAGDDRSKAMRVAIFPVLDREGSAIPNLRRAVINPERSFEPNPIKTLARVNFIEQQRISINWDGMCLGELSHTENLMPGESKTITIEKQTRFKEKLSSSFENEVIASTKDTVSFEEKLSQEVNNEETSEEEIMRESEEKQEREQKERDTRLGESTDSSTTTVKARIEGSKKFKTGMLSGSVSGSKTNKIENLNRHTQENENAVKDSKKLTEKNSSKQGRKSQQKNLSERIGKTASETSNTNKTSVKKTSEQESESMDKRLETIEISNQNVGKTLNYYFFQLQNIYTTKTETENVKIVINPGHEIIAKSGISDVRVFNLADFGDIFEEIGGATSNQNLLICGLIMNYIKEYYQSPIPDNDSEAGLFPNISYKNIKEVIADLIEELKKDKNIKIIEELKARMAGFYKDLKEQDSLFEFNPIKTNEPEVVAVNSGGLYLDVEVGKKMATEPYLENRRDIETHLQNTKVKQLEAEVKHLEAQTQAGIFFPPPQSTPIKTVPVNVNVGDSAGDKENSGSPFSSFPQDTSSSTTEEKTASEPADNTEKNK